MRRCEGEAGEEEERDADPASGVDVREREAWKGSERKENQTTRRVKEGRERASESREGASGPLSGVRLCSPNGSGERRVRRRVAAAAHAGRVSSRFLQRLAAVILWAPPCHNSRPQLRRSQASLCAATAADEPRGGSTASLSILVALLALVPRSVAHMERASTTARVRRACKADDDESQLAPSPLRPRRDGRLAEHSPTSARSSPWWWSPFLRSSTRLACAL